MRSTYEHNTLHICFVVWIGPCHVAGRNTFIMTFWMAAMISFGLFKPLMDMKNIISYMR
jgi:hypothetical protein